jgi:hypothetical protein
MIEYREISLKGDETFRIQSGKGERIKLVSGGVKYTASADAANRSPKIDIYTSTGKLLYSIGISAALTANQLGSIGITPENNGIPRFSTNGGGMDETLNITDAIIIENGEFAEFSVGSGHVNDVLAGIIKMLKTRM